MARENNTTYTTVQTTEPHTQLQHMARFYPGDAVVGCERTTLTVEPGTPVLVDAFGRRRPGTVIKVNRTTALVEYARNAEGTLARRAFKLTSLQPGPGASFTREEVQL